MNVGSWLGWQIDYLLLLQNFREITNHIFDRFFICITVFGEVMIPVIIICILYWAINKKVGQFLILSWITGFITNIFLKVTACIYRPWILDSRIHPVAQAIPAATGYSFPSGHTAGVVSVWGGLAVFFWKNKIIQYLCIAIILLVMFSRNYLGVHTPQDVIVSFFVTGFVLYGIYKLQNWEEKGKNRDIIITLCFTLVTIVLLLYTIFKSYPIHYLFGNILYDPTPVKYDALNKSGFIFGSVFGWLIEKRCINFSPEQGSLLKKIFRVLIGIILLFGLYTTKQSVPFGTVGIFVQHVLIGLFITCIYPLVIKKYNF